MAKFAATSSRRGTVALKVPRGRATASRTTPTGWCCSSSPGAPTTFCPTKTRSARSTSKVRTCRKGKMKGAPGRGAPSTQFCPAGRLYSSPTSALSWLQFEAARNTVPSKARTIKLRRPGRDRGGSIMALGVPLTQCLPEKRTKRRRSCSTAATRWKYLFRSLAGGHAELSGSRPGGGTVAGF